MDKSKNLKTVEIEDAEKLLREATLKRVELCRAEVEQVLKKHQITMLPQVIIRGEQIIAQVAFLPTPQQPEA